MMWQCVYQRSTDVGFRLQVPILTNAVAGILVGIVVQVSGGLKKVHLTLVSYYEEPREGGYFLCLAISPPFRSHPI